MCNKSARLHFLRVFSVCTCIASTPKSYLSKSKYIVLKYYFGENESPRTNSKSLKVSDSKCTEKVQENETHYLALVQQVICKVTSNPCNQINIIELSMQHSSRRWKELFLITVLE